jgi:signal transduction histidine kinase
MSNILSLLQNLSLFEGVAQPVLAEIASVLIKREVKPGEIIAKEGEVGDSMFIIASGRIKVHLEALTLAELGPSNLVGEFSLIDTAPRSASLTAIEPTELYVLTQPDFTRVIVGHSDALLGVTRYIVRRMRSQNDKTLADAKQRETELESKVAERTSELSEKIDESIRTNSQLMRVNSHKDDIIKIVSHDIRSPVTGITNLAALLQDDDIATDPAQVRNYGKLIASSSAAVTKFVNDILDLAKLESGTTELTTARLELQAFLKNQAATFEPLTVTKGVKLILDLQEPLTVDADRSKLSQAFNNLISNSIKFTPKGGSVTLRLVKREHQGKTYASASISDTGIGIPAEAIPGLFEKFNKIQRTGTSGEKGTGLGMSIAKQIIDLHKGDILVESVVNQGTTFSILLPLAA